MNTVSAAAMPVAIVGCGYWGPNLIRNFFASRHFRVALVVDKDEAGFVAHLVDFAHTYGLRARRDHQIFVDLFRNGRLPGL